MNNGQKILAKIVELTNSPLNIVGSQALYQSNDESDWDVLVPFQFQSQIMKMISELSITTDTHWYEENSYIGEKLFEDLPINGGCGIRMYIDYRGTEFKIDLLFSNLSLRSSKCNSISLIGIPGILNKNATLIYQLVVENKNTQNINVEKFTKEWEQNIITGKIKEFKFFCNINPSIVTEFENFIKTFVNFKLHVHVTSLLNYGSYCPTNLDQFRI